MYLIWNAHTSWGIMLMLLWSKSHCWVNILVRGRKDDEKMKTGINSYHLFVSHFSGLLLSYLTFIRMAKSNGKISILTFYFHRLWRFVFSFKHSYILSSKNGYVKRGYFIPDLEEYDPVSLCSAVWDSRQYYQSLYRQEMCGQFLF